MVNINLASGDVQTQQQGEEKTKSGWMVPLEFIGIIIIIGAIAFLYFDTKNLDKKIKVSKDEYEIQATKLRSESARNVFDFQNRINKSEMLMEGNVSSLEILGALEKTIIPEAFLNSFTFDLSKKEISLVYYARSFDQVARQISALKASTYLLDVSSGETKITDKGLIEFSALMKIK